MKKTAKKQPNTAPAQRAVNVPLSMLEIDIIAEGLMELPAKRVMGTLQKLGQCKQQLAASIASQAKKGPAK
jgi:hypothetical protein